MWSTRSAASCATPDEPSSTPRHDTPSGRGPSAPPGPLSRRRRVAAAVLLAGLAALLTAAVVIQLRRAPEPAVPPLSVEMPAGKEHDGGGTVGQGSAVLAAAQAAIAAWGQFATSGEPHLLETHFDPAGPQYARLADEAAERAADPAGYHMTLIPLDARPTGDGRWLVTGHVRLHRAGRLASAWRWQLELRGHPDHGWRVWTVEPADSGP